MEAEKTLERPLSAQVINTVTDHGQIEDVGAAVATADVVSADLLTETPTEILKREKGRKV